MPDDGQGFTGESYDNSGALGANRWRHVAFIEQRKPLGRRPRRRRTRSCKEAALQGLVEDAGIETADGRRHALADELGRLQALHARGLPRRLPDRRALPHRVRHRRRPGGRLQRLRLLRGRLPVRRARPARGRRAGVEVHALLRPPEGRPRARLREGVPDRTRSSSASSTSCASAPSGASSALHERGVADARLYGDDPDDGVGGFGAFFLLLDEPEVYGLPPDPVVTTRDLPRDLEDDRGSRRPRSARAIAGGVRWAGAAMTRGGRGESGDGARRPSRAPTTGGPVIKPPVWKPEIPWYLFLGGLAGASATLALGRRRDRQPQARRATRA